MIFIYFANNNYECREVNVCIYFWKVDIFNFIILFLHILSRIVLLYNSNDARVQIPKEEILPKTRSGCGRRPEKGEFCILSKYWTFIWYKNLTKKNKVYTDSLEAGRVKLYFKYAT